MSRPPEPRPFSSDGLRVVLVDDHRLLREGLKRILSMSPDIEVVGEADDGHEALALIRRTAPQVAVVDLNMPGLSGMNLIHRIRSDHPATAVLVLSMNAEQHYAMRALKSGAQGYLTKDAASEELVLAVRKVAGGGCHLSRGMAERVAMSLVQHDDGPAHDQLSEREFEVFRLIVSGQRMTDIADTLHLSIKTVSTHKSRLLQKLQLDNTAALIRYGLQHRLFNEAAGMPETGLSEGALTTVAAGGADLEPMVVRRAKPAIDREWQRGVQAVMTF